MLWTIISAMALLIALAAEGRITVQQAAGGLLVAVLIGALGAKASVVLRAALAMAALYLLVVHYGGASDARLLFTRLAELALVLCGIWIMLRGLVRSSR